EVDPLPGLELEVALRKNDGQLHDRGRELFDLRDSCGMLGHLPHSRFRELLDLLEDSLAFESAKTIEKEVAIEMIDLVRKRASHQPFAPHVARLAIASEKAHVHALRPLDNFREVGNRETAFIFVEMA